MSVLGAAAGAWAQSSTKTYTYDALGRLTAAQTVGGQNNNQTHSLCYDPAGNRQTYKATSDGTVAACTPGPSPSPSPTPTPTNSPPVTQLDSATVECAAVTTVNLTANDSDPEGNYPLSLVSIVRNSGRAKASIASASSASVTGSVTNGGSTFTYTVQDLARSPGNRDPECHYHRLHLVGDAQ